MKRSGPPTANGSKPFGQLKAGFAIYMAGTLSLFIQFLFYFLQSSIAPATDAVGYAYYLIAAFAHAGMLALIPYLPYLPLSLLLPFPRLHRGWLITAYFLLNLLAFLNGMVFQLYKFHINGLVIHLIFGPDAGQVFHFAPALVAKFILMAIGLSAGFVGLLWTARRFYARLRKRQILSYVLFFAFSTLYAHLFHAYAAAAHLPSVQTVAACLPQFYPLTANTLMLKLGLIQPDDLYSPLQENTLTGITYPQHPLTCQDSIPEKNIIFILLDSWNPRTFHTETMPRLCRFAEKSSVFTHHLSSSNGTRGGLFGLFFGVSPTYWKAFELSGTTPLLIHTLLQRGYGIRTFPSATLLNPPFHRIIFGEVRDIRTNTPGATPFDRDNRLTEDFIRYLDSSPRRPFFAFLFYDLLHAIDLPEPYRHKFRPSWDYADYLALNNRLDPAPFFNLYRNCAWHADSLIGKVLDKLQSSGLLENSIVVVSGDHGQEFNENKKNYWGHGSNYSEAQIQVPFFYYDAGQSPRRYRHTTTHYDVVPTLMHDVLGVCNPPEDYSMGHFLTDSVRPAYHLAGSEENYAIILPGMIYEKKHTGRIVATDSCLNPTKRSPSPQLLLEIIRYKNRFQTKD